MGGFREFVTRGNVVDLAVAVIIGAAFTLVVASLTDDVIMPVIGWLTGDHDFSNYFIRLGELPAGYAGDPSSYAALKAAGVPMIGYGQFISTIINFLIVAFIIYMIVRALKKASRERAAEAAPDPAEVVLLREIRDELRNRGSGPTGS
ncbi:large conductance mechanosensitive channel protein MscL [Allosphingosinicella sp.]|jgi:large conductance mechanosensitive channel|uniref:large conductance mechanosensitive channel protein MscL n=1 Tax=Allosphingosinicella sp. TaxID=2823234 RepID=UPI002EF29470